MFFKYAMPTNCGNEILWTAGYSLSDHKKKWPDNKGIKYNPHSLTPRHLQTELAPACQQNGLFQIASTDLQIHTSREKIFVSALRKMEGDRKQTTRSTIWMAADDDKNNIFKTSSTPNSWPDEEMKSLVCIGQC